MAPPTTASKNFDDTVELVKPILLARYYLLAGGVWPVWVDLQVGLDAHYTANFQTSADATAGINAVKTISVGKKWDSTSSWQWIFDNPPVDFNFVTPTWQVLGSADIRADLQPKVSVLVYSAAGVTADLDPYLDFQGNVQANPDLELSAGLDSNIGLDLSVWDKKLPPLPSVTLNLISTQRLWHASGPSGSTTPPQITLQPVSRSASLGSTISFVVQAQGSEPLIYRWYRNGLYLTDDSRVNGSGSSTLRIVNVQTSDAGNYSVRVANQTSTATSAAATLTVNSFSPRPNPNEPAIHWVNDAGQDAITILNSGSPFITNFKARNDVQLTLLSGTVNSIWRDSYGGPSAGNNPWYITNFVGIPSNGTGDGIAGHLNLLEMSPSDGGGLQLDFFTPLSPNDHILLADTDGSEKYVLQAYVFDGASYQPVSVAGWLAEDFSGQMEVLPDSRWPAWDAVAGTLTSSSLQNPQGLNEPLFVLTPNRNIDRFVIVKQSGSGWTTAMQFLTSPSSP